MQGKLMYSTVNLSESLKNYNKKMMKFLWVEFLFKDVFVLKILSMLKLA